VTDTLFFPSGLADIVAAIMLLTLMGYALTGGADFGGGVWDLLASGPRKEQQRDHIARSLAPIWEANHVWLIVVVVLLFTGFPKAFSQLSIVLHIPLTIMLLGIVLRGSAFVFRSYGAHTEVQRHRWGATFAVASVITPVCLGVVIGAVTSGDVGAAAARAGQPGAAFGDVFVRPWLGAFPLLVGGFALTLFAFLAAVYLALNAPSPELADDFRSRAMTALGAGIAFGLAAFFAGHRAAPTMFSALSGSLWQWLGVAATIAAMAALRARRYRLARIAAGVIVVAVLGGWAVSQYPFIIPATLTIRDAAAPAVTLRLLLIGLAGGALILIPSLRYLFRLFGRTTSARS
jgi:cytochrome d ubiquinol oxidase subunit II